MKKWIAFSFFISISLFVFIACNDKKTETTPATAKESFGGFESQVKWGEHLVAIAGCNDCHTPKKMGQHGPEDDISLMLSGHPAQAPAPDFDRAEAAKKGLIVTQSFTAWTGPWGTTFAPNLTSDTTGIGGWKEEQFLKALHELKWMGLENTRPLMPPMSMMPATKMSDDELKAIFAYLKTTPPVKNTAPEAVLLPPPAAK
jgi:cytochrome c553